MKDKIYSIIFSNKFTAILFIIFPTAMAFGTFIESWYGIDTARIMIYNAWWFELILVLFVFNFIGNIFEYKLLRKNKWSILLLHLSFIIIIIGAFITRYFGFEGVMPIREGDSKNVFISEKTYLTVLVDGKINDQSRRKKLEKEVLFSESVDNYFKWNNDFNGEEFSIEYIDYVENVYEDLILDDLGERYLKIVEARDGNRHEHYIKEGQITSIHNILFTLNKKQNGAINIRVDKGVYFIEMPFDANFMRMVDQFSGNVYANIESPLQFRSLYTISNFQFVIPDPALRGYFDFVKGDVINKNVQDLLQLEIKTGNQKNIVKIIGGKGLINESKKISIENLDFNIIYGSKLLELPFSIKLNNFIAEKYPGTEKSYSSFMSKITVEDENEFDFDIYMNNILDHKGYRFFQASFDPDEKGTVLSVNHDWWGTFITYIGYILLYSAMIGTLSTTSRPKLSSPTLLVGLLVRRRIFFTPRSSRIWAPTPYCRGSGANPSIMFASTVSKPSSCNAYAFNLL